MPDPVPAPGEVLIEVAATAVNRADLLQRQGFYPPPPGAPEYPGLECSGRIAALGDGVDGWAVGDEVCALLSGGGYAERVAVPAGQVLRVPRGLSLIDAAAVVETTCTVSSMVFDAGRLQPGETLLVHGGAGGIGTTAVQMSVALGARVLVTVGSPEKASRCLSLGAAAAINYRESVFEERVRELTDGRGADVILDNMGASYLARNLKALAPDGRLLVLGLQGGRTAEIDLAALMAKRATVYGATLRARSAADKARVVARTRERVWPLLESGAVRAVIDRVLPIEQAAEAHRVIEAGEQVGKVVLQVR